MKAILTVTVFATLTLFAAGQGAAQGVVTTGEKEILALIRTNHWDAAETALRKIVEANPYKGLNFYLLGAVLEHNGDCRAAMPMLTKAIALGADGRRTTMRRTHLTAARCASRMGDGAGAYRHVHAAWRDWGWRDFSDTEGGEAYVALRRNPDYRALAKLALPISTDDMTRKARADLAYYVKLIEETHPDPFHAIPRSAWRKAVADFNRRIPRSSSLDIIAGFMRLGAMIGDGHTSVFPPIEGPQAFHVLNIWPMWTRDGWHIVAAEPKHKGLVGTRVVAVGGRPFAEVFDKISRFLPRDNVRTRYWLAQAYLQLPEIYQAVGAAKPGKNVALTVESADGVRRTVTLPAAAAAYDPTAHFAPADWPTMAGDRLPRYLRHAHALFAMDVLPKANAVYAVLNNVRNGEEKSLGAFGTEIAQALTRRPGARLILDLRLNNGGDGNLRWDFLSPLTAVPDIRKAGQLIVLIGPRSYSATMMLAGDLQSKFGAVFIGMPTGGRPVNYTTETPFTLPNTGISGTISARLQIDGLSMDDRRPFIAPDVVAWPTAADITARRDPLLEAAIAYPAAPK